MKIFTETKRFLLREMVETDVLGMFDLDSDPEVHRYLGNNPVQTLDQSLAMIQGVREQYDEVGLGRWVIEDKATKEFVGWSGLKYETRLRKEFDYYDLGYRLRRKFWGQGIATETALASLQYGFTELELDEICAAADVNNIASNIVLQKVGLQFVETFDFMGSKCNWYKIGKSDWQENAEVG